MMTAHVMKHVNTRVAQDVVQHFLYLKSTGSVCAIFSLVNFKCPTCYCSTVEQYVVSSTYGG
jgi:hypothetical protein